LLCTLPYLSLPMTSRSVSNSHFRQLHSLRIQFVKHPSKSVPPATLLHDPFLPNRHVIHLEPLHHFTLHAVDDSASVIIKVDIHRVPLVPKKAQVNVDVHLRRQPEGAIQPVPNDDQLPNPPPLSNTQWVRRSCRWCTRRHLCTCPRSLSRKRPGDP
jgi:hypothetical protein